MKKIILLAAAVLTPTLTFAQSQFRQPQPINVSGLSGTIRGITTIVNYVIPLGISVAVIAFIYGIIKYLLAKDPKEQGDARKFLINGVLAITVILAVFGIARLFINLFGLNPLQLSNTEIPTVGTNPPIDGTGGFGGGGGGNTGGSVVVPPTDGNGSYTDEGKSCTSNSDCPSGQACVDGGICQHG